jgi:hypothetical protein
MPFILSNTLFIHGKHFPPSGVFAGYLFLAVGAVALFSNPLVALFPIGTGLFLSFTLLGCEVDLEKKRVREYSRVFWTRQGTWEPMDDFPDMAVMRKTLSHTMYSYYSNQSIINSEVAYDVSLLTPDHRERITVCRYPDAEHAMKAAKELAQQWNKNFTSFSPPMSAASRRRRR